MKWPLRWPLRLRTQWHDLQAALWFRPAAATILAVILAITLTTLDTLPYFTAPVLLRIGADSARAVLAAIAGAMLAVVGMVFSILMVALVLASQQFSPRILRNFSRDRVSQDVLGIFIGAFIYSLLVLARISEHEDRVFTPVLSVTGAIVLAIIAIGAFIYFIDHIAKTVRVSYIIAGINRQTETLLQRMVDETTEMHVEPAANDDEKWPPEGVPAKAIHSPRSGNIQVIDYGRLLKMAEEHSLRIVVERQVGDFVARDAPLLTLYMHDNVSQTLFDTLYSAFDIGTERTMFSDTLFGIRQLADIALKASSPAVNDPTTTVNCIDYLTNILIQAAHHADVRGRFYDDQGRLRLVAPRPTFTMMLDLAFDQIRHYMPDAQVTLRLLDGLAEIARATGDAERHAAIWRHATMISRRAALSIAEPLERAQINERLREIAARCGASLEGIELDNATAPLLIPLPIAAAPPKP
jgi:uncharacterized membrane protein